MAKAEHIELLQQGVGVWNKWREQNPTELADLSGYELRRTILERPNFRSTLLANTVFREVWFDDADFSFSLMYGAKFYKSHLYGAKFDNALADWTDFSGTDLRRVDFHQARLFESNFTGAHLGNTQFTRVDMRGIHGLESIKHWGPSSIGIDTLLESQGQFPDIFLRGCGVPEEFINYAHSLAMNPIEYYSCFISYSHKNEEFAQRLYLALQAHQLRVWYAPEDMKRGQKIHEQIDAAIQGHDRLLLVLSEESMGSEWVKTEIYNARQREIKEDRRILFPISLVPFGKIKEWKFFDGDTGKDLAREIREYYIPDFSNWKDHDSFETEFKKLVRDLKAN